MRGLSGEGVERGDGGAFVRPLLHVQLGPVTGVPHVLRRRSPQQVRDQLQLREGSGGLEEDAPGEEFGEDASHGPHVDGVRVVPAAHQQFRGPVVLGHDLLSHGAPAVRLLDAGQAEITDLEQTITIDQKVARLNVTVQDPRRVQVLEAAQDLVQEHLYVVCGQWLRGDDDLMQITLHQLRYHVSAGEREWSASVPLIQDSSHRRHRRSRPRHCRLLTFP